MNYMNMIIVADLGLPLSRLDGIRPSNMTRCKLFLLMMWPKKVSFLDIINCMMFLFSPILSSTVSFFVWLCDEILCIFRQTHINL